MKRSLLFASVVGLLLIVGYAMHNVQAQKPPQNLQWEYRFVVVPIDVFVAAERAASQNVNDSFAGQKAIGHRLEGIFNELGDKGWELASYNDAMAIFKRSNSRHTKLLQ